MSNKDQQPPPIPAPRLLPKVINGGIAGIVGVSVVFPLDLVKTRLQNQTIGPKGEKQYKNMIDCFKKTYAAEGYFGMYKGSSVNIILVSPEKAIKLSSNDMFRYYLTLPNGHLSIFRQMIAGGLAGAFQIIVSTPMELLKIQMQDAGRIAAQAKAEGRTIKTTSAIELTKKVVAEGGIFGLYKGVTATAGRDIIFSVIYFPMFAAINDFGVKDDKGGIPSWWTFFAGVAAGSTSALSVTPWDVIKTRMQTLTKGKGERQCSSNLDCITQIMKYEGLTAFFKGGACRMIVIAPLYGIAQTVYYIGIAENYLGIK